MFARPSLMFAAVIASGVVVGASAMQSCPNGPPVPPPVEHSVTDVCEEWTPCDAHVLGSGFRCRFCTNDEQVRAACFAADPQNPPIDRPVDVPCWDIFIEAGCGTIMEGTAKFNPDGTVTCINAVDSGLCCHRAYCAYIAE